MTPLRFHCCCRNVAAAIALAGIALQADAAVIDLKDSAQVSAGIVRLADVAEVEDADPLLSRQLAAVSLGPAPADGRKVRLTQQTIRQRLLAHGTNLSEIEFTGQSVVIVSGPEHARSEVPAKERPAKPISVRPLPVSSLLRKKADTVLQQAFHRHYHSAGTDVGPLELKIEISDDDIPLLLDADPQRIRFVEPGLEWGGPQRLTAHLPQADGSSRVIVLQVWLNEVPQILTVKHAVPKGQRIKESDLTLISAKNGETGLNQGRDLVGQEATRELRPGQPLQSRDAAQTPLVRSGDLVTVKVNEPGLTVSRVFRATGSGGAGEVVSLVALEDPREKIQATVTAWHEAEMTIPRLSELPSSSLPRQRSRRGLKSDSDSSLEGRP